MLTTLSAKFTRNPKFTPASLDERTLSRIEWLVKALFKREAGDGGEFDMEFWPEFSSGKRMLSRETKRWFSPFWGWEHKAGLSEITCINARKARHDKRIAWLSNNKDACQYFVNCWNYLVTIAVRRGEIKEPSRMSAREWYTLRNGYGHF